MATTASLTIVKEFPYRDAPEEWSNTYHLDTAPVDQNHWEQLSHLVVSLERAVWSPVTKVVRGVGHAPGNPVAVFEWNYVGDAAHGGPGLLNVSGASAVPGDAAAWIRWTTTQVNSRGKPIYLRSYFHDIFINIGGDRDALYTAQKDALQIYGNEWANGMSVSGVTYRRAGPRGAVGQVAEVGQWITTRTLERRGARRRRLPAGATVQLPPITIN